MRRLLLFLITCLSIAPAIRAGDTIVVKTLTFNDITKRTGTWLFPPAQRYEKVLMYYTLKCDERTTQDRFPCGEWDYLTYTTLTDSTGRFDSTRMAWPSFASQDEARKSFSVCWPRLSLDRVTRRWLVV